MSKEHIYATTLTWTGNQGTGTSDYRAYSRNHSVKAGLKPELAMSSDPAFRGDPTRYNPEELLLMSLSSCHMLWYLHLCAVAGVVVVDYVDNASGTMVETPDGNGHFSEVTLNPVVIVKEEAMVARAQEIHHKANKMCFIANSCNFPVKHNPVCKVA